MSDMFGELEGDKKSAPEGYRVLARAYRPSTFSELIGQEALVRTLSNAIQSGRLAHAFLLTGIRGIGKTTTARIIAKALNCLGVDGQGGATTDPCGVCDNCKSITEDRHVDVMEMDAASHTGVGDIRDLIETVHYMPVSARYKVYIIDEVHMLSTSAFNALLKTLEEPPPHVKFIFATTEIRKIPLTILSRCQRFDLRRVNNEELAAHLHKICEKEGVIPDASALALIAGASEGSVRDSLSLLDQAISHGEGTISAAYVQEMLGMADKARVMDLFDALMQGDMPQTLAVLNDMYNAGADPVLLLQDLLELTHLVTRMKIVPALKDDISLPELSRTRGSVFAEKLAMPVLARCWQMLLKGVGEVQYAPNPLMAAEMVLVRIAHVAELPLPVDVIKQAKQNAMNGAPSGSASVGSAGGGGGGYSSAASVGTVQSSVSAPAPVSAPTMSLVSSVHSGGSSAHHAQVMMSEPEPQLYQPQVLSGLEDVAQLFEAHKEMLMASRIRQDARLVSFAEGRIEIQSNPLLPANFTKEISASLKEWTGKAWVVALSQTEGQPTLQEVRLEAEQQEKDRIASHPKVAEILTLFPGARITRITDKENAE